MVQGLPDEAIQQFIDGGPRLIVYRQLNRTEAVHVLQVRERVSQNWLAFRTAVFLLEGPRDDVTDDLWLVV